MDLAVVSIISGSATAVLAGVVALVRIAVNAAERRADDWREIARTATATNSVNAEHVGKLVSAVGELTTAQRESLVITRESLTLIQGLAAERRGAA